MEITFILLVLVALGIGGLLVYLFVPRQANNDQHRDTLDTVRQQQSELAGRLAALGAAQESARGELNRTMSEQFGNLFKTVNDNLKETRDKTTSSLGELGQRLSLIDKAQKEITALSGQVVELQQILDNKQARGAFGETQLADIVRDGLPESAYQFQHTLSTGKQADCLIQLPNPPGPIVVDSKFPLEAYQKLRNAQNKDEERIALAQMKIDTLKHANDIATKYIVPGETADAALMFFPSESFFSEIHLRLPGVIDKCRALRVYPVSPNTMSLTLNTVRAIMRDVKMRQHAGVIQQEVHVLLEDMGRLDERVTKLRAHFELADKDIDQIEVSTRKIGSRGDKITNLELDDAAPDLLE